jgi:hypothetical protein
VLAQSLTPRSSPSLACRMHGISTGQRSTWRKQFRSGELTGFVPIPAIADAALLEPTAVQHVTDTVRFDHILTHYYDGDACVTKIADRGSAPNLSDQHFLRSLPSLRVALREDATHSHSATATATATAMAAAATTDGQGTHSVRH